MGPFEAEIEKQRVKLQTDLDRQKSRAERNKLGQFHTPSALADELFKFARHQVSNEIVSFLDPALGTGTFYSALIRNFESSRIKSAVGYEIDPFYSQPTRELWHNFDLDIRAKDFTRETPSEKYNLIVCNPPYVRHHHISDFDKQYLKRKTAKIAGATLSGLAGLYCHFLILADSWLEDNGLACWLVPSEFMDVNYGDTVKKYLVEKVTLLQIHRFDPNDVQFDDALVSSAVVWFKKSLPPKNHSVKFTFGGSLLRPSNSRNVSIHDLAQELKWSRFPVSDVRVKNQGSILGDFFKIKRGLATGKNDFFILTENEINTRNLPIGLFRPVLPGPRFLHNNIVESMPDGSPLVERKLYLLDVEIPEREIELNYPSLDAYLKEGKSLGYDKGYLCSSRQPWYAQEKRPAAPIVCTYMSRSSKSQGPFRFILNNSMATVTNVYLALYPNPRLQRVLEEDVSVIYKIWEALNSLAKEKLLDESRVYGGGLRKLEPKELARVPIECLQNVQTVVESMQYELPL